MDPADPTTIQDLTNLAAAVSSATVSDIPNLTGVSAVTTVLDPSNPPVTPESGSNPNTKYIIIGCVVGAAVLTGVILLTWYLCKKMRESSPVDPHIDQPSMEKLERDPVVFNEVDQSSMQATARKEDKRDL